jgi:hypothetical protein
VNKIAPVMELKTTPVESSMPTPKEMFGGLSFGEKKIEVSDDAPVTAPAQIKSNRPKTWEGFIELCFEHKPVLAVVLESVVEWTVPLNPGDSLKLGFREKDQVKAEQLQQKAFRDQFAQMIEVHFGFRSPVEIFFSKNEGESMAEKTVRTQNEAREIKMQNILSNSIVQEAKSLFGADLQIELNEKEK